MNVYTISLSPINLKFNPEEASPIMFPTCHPIVVDFLKDANFATEEERKTLSPLGCCGWIAFIICFILILPFVCFIIYLAIKSSNAKKAFIEKLKIVQAKYNPQLNQHGVNVALKEQIYVTGSRRHHHTVINFYFEFTFRQPTNPMDQMYQPPISQGYSNQTINLPPATLDVNQGYQSQKI